MSARRTCGSPSDDRWFQKAVFYEVLTRGFFKDSNDDGTGDLRRHHREARLPVSGWASTASGCCPSTSRPCATAATTSPTSSPRPAGVRRPSVTRWSLVEESPQAWHPHHRRHGGEPHQRRPPLVPGVAVSGPHQPEGRLVRLERGRPPAGPTPASSSLDTEPSRTGRGTPSAASTTGTASSTTSPTSTTTTPRSAEAMLDVVRYWLDIGLDGFRLDAVPYLYERDGTNGENLHRDPRVPEAGSARRSTTSTPAPCCWPRRTSGPSRRRRLLR